MLASSLFVLGDGTVSDNFAHGGISNSLFILPCLKGSFLTVQFCIDRNTCITDQTLRYHIPPELLDDSKWRITCSTFEAQQNQWIAVHFLDYYLIAMEPTGFPQVSSD